MGSLLLLLGCGEPFVMIPGGRLSGTTKSVPENWRFTDAHEDVQLETRPADPYSVNVWVVAVGDDLFVASGRGAESAWAQHIEADPNVRLRVGDDIYELRAVEADTKLIGCNGGLRLGQRFFRCWEPLGHGRLGLIDDSL